MPEPGEPVPSGPEILAQEYRTGAGKELVRVLVLIYCSAITTRKYYMHTYILPVLILLLLLRRMVTSPGAPTAATYDVLLYT